MNEPSTPNSRRDLASGSDDGTMAGSSAGLKYSVSSRRQQSRSSTRKSSVQMPMTPMTGNQSIPRQLSEASEVAAASSPISGLITFSTPVQTPPGQMRYPLRSSRRTAKAIGANSNAGGLIGAINVAGGRPDIDCSLIGDEPPCKKFRSSNELEEAAGASSPSNVPSAPNNQGSFEEVASVHGGETMAVANENIASVKSPSLVDVLPDEMLVRITGYLLEGDLCRLASVCRRLNRIANDLSLWERLYGNVFEYDVPLYHPEPCRFEFRDIWNIANPWKESFKMLHRGLHVRCGYADRYANEPGRTIKYFDKIETAVQYAADLDEPQLVFIHSGVYLSENLVVDYPLQMIGAAPGDNVAHEVIIEKHTGSTIHFTEGAHGAYLGYCTIRFSPDSNAALTHNGQYAVEITDACSPVIEHCIIHSSASVGAALCVRKHNAMPQVKHCTICDCENVGIFVTDGGQGTFEDIEIARNLLAGVWVKNNANPIFRRCHIHHGRDVGAFIFEHGAGYFDKCNIHNNRISGIEVKQNGNPTVVRSEIHHGQTGGIYVHEEGRGRFLENKIYANNFAGIWITSHSEPTIRKTKSTMDIKEACTFLGKAAV